MKAIEPASKFRVGDKVGIDFGRRKFTGFIKEDRGEIGINGRRLFQVEIPMEPFEPMTLELPEEEMEPLPRDQGSSKSIDKKHIIQYLSEGGLVSILRSNLSGGRNQPMAWLCLGQLGDVTHTFNPERGVVGGHLVPLLALHEDKVFSPKRDAVLSFLESFGLNLREAEKVISRVGMAP